MTDEEIIMEFISQTFNYKGFPVKIENGKIYLRAFGTTMYNQSMHYSWQKVSIHNLKPELRNIIKEKGLI